MSPKGRSKAERLRIEQMFSGLPPKADLGSALAPVASRPSINNTADGPIGISRRSWLPANEERE